MPVDPVPEGYHTVTPYLIVSDVPSLIRFLGRAFGAREVRRMDRPDGTIMHAEVRIGDSIVMMGEAGGEWPPMPTCVHLYVADVDAVYRRALEAGGKSVQEPADMPYGDRSGGVRDFAGNLWWIATHVEDVSDDELARRQASGSVAEDERNPPP